MEMFHFILQEICVNLIAYYAGIGITGITTEENNKQNVIKYSCSFFYYNIVYTKKYDDNRKQIN